MGNAVMDSYVAFVDVGHGNCTVLKDGDTIAMVDCGSKGPYLVEFLLQSKITAIDTIFVSHADQDHIGGLVSILESGKIKVKKIYINSDASKGSRTYDDLTYELSHLTQAGILDCFIGIQSGKEFLFGAINLRTISPTAYLALKGPGGVDRKGRELTSNSVSASFLVEWSGRSLAYLAGDIDQMSLDELVEHRVGISAQVLVFPHHGGDCTGGNVVNFTIQLCSLVKPETVIFSIGRNKHSNPRVDVMEAVKSNVRNVIIACTQLSKHCAKEIPKVAPVHLSNFFARGAAKGLCCAGTMVIELGENAHFLPDFSSHQAFIDAAVENPICRNIMTSQGQ